MSYRRGVFFGAAFTAVLCAMSAVIGAPWWVAPAVSVVSAAAEWRWCDPV